MVCLGIDLEEDKCGGQRYLTECIESSTDINELSITTESTQKDINRNITLSLNSLIGRVKVLQNI